MFDLFDDFVKKIALLLSLALLIIIIFCVSIGYCVGVKVTLKQQNAIESNKPATRSASELLEDIHNEIGK